MLKTRAKKIEELFELLYNEIREKNNEVMNLEKNLKIEVSKDKFIELIKDMETSLKISRECINKSEIIADVVSEGYFSNKRKDQKRKEEQKQIEESKERKKVNNS